MIKFASLVIHNYEAAVADFEVVHDIEGLDVEEEFWETVLVYVDCHDTGFRLYEDDLIVEWGYFGFYWSPIVNSEESHDLAGDIE